MTCRNPKLLPYPKNIGEEDRETTREVLHDILDNHHTSICGGIGFRSNINPIIPDTVIKYGMRKRCSSCDKMIEKNEVQFIVYTMTCRGYTKWTTKVFHLLCFISHLDEMQTMLIDEIKKTVSLSDTLKSLVNEKKLWFRTIPEIKED